MKKQEDTSGTPTPSLFPYLGRGLGLRREHYHQVTTETPPVDWFELISENFMVPGGNPRRVWESVRRDYPVVLHGVSLSIGAEDPLNADYLKRLRDLADEVQPAWVSDHLCWGTAHGIYAHDLLPLANTQATLNHVAARVAHVQGALGRRILLENPSTYMALKGADMSEWEFLAALAKQADCGILLDVNNVFVSAHNHGFDARAYIDAMPAERIGQIHLAGHSIEGPLRIDTHDNFVCDEVWSLYEYALSRWGLRSAMIEWDADVPSLETLQGELAEVRARDEKVTGNVSSSASSSRAAARRVG